jgi:hypothetical protein
MARTLAFAWPLMLALGLGMLQEPLPTKVLPPRERVWHRQIEDVRAGRAHAIAVVSAHISDEDLADLDGITGLIKLELHNSDVTAAGVRRLQALPNLRRVALGGRPVGDEEFVALCQIPTLRELVLTQSTVTDRGLAALRDGARLEQLRLSSPFVTDEGVAPMASLKRLRMLHLLDMPLVTDAGLLQLETMTQLESLYLDGMNVSDDGIERLLRRLPELHFHVDQQHHARDPKRGTHSH